MKKLILSIVTLLSVSFFLSCNDTTGSNDNSDKNSDDTISNETNNVVSIFGKVLGGDGSPMPGVFVTLKKQGVSVQTNSEGEYLIELESLNNSSRTEGTIEGTIEDTVEIKSDGQVITNLMVDDYIDTLSDVFVVQRDIYGEVNTSSITDDSQIPSFYDAHIFQEINGKIVFIKSSPLGYNTSTSSITGFIYFVKSPEIENYEVFVNAYNADSSLLGRSEIVTFSSLFGDIEIPSIIPTNGVPTISIIQDITEDSVKLIINGEDELGGQIIEMGWSIDDGATFSTDQALQFSINDISSLPINQVISKVTDDDGLSALDTIASAQFLTNLLPYFSETCGAGTYDSNGVAISLDTISHAFTISFNGGRRTLKGRPLGFSENNTLIKLYQNELLNIKSYDSCAIEIEYKLVSSTGNRLFLMGESYLVENSSEFKIDTIFTNIYIARSGISYAPSSDTSLAELTIRKLRLIKDN